MTAAQRSTPAQLAVGGGSGRRVRDPPADDVAHVIPHGSPDGPEDAATTLGNVVFFAVFFLLSKGSRDHLGVLPFLFGVMTAAALTVSVHVALSPSDTVLTATSTDVWYGFVAAGPGTLGHLMTTWPLRWLPANVPPVLRLGVPVLASLWAWWFLGEAITAVHLTGGAITIVGVAGAVLSPAGRRFVDREAAAVGPRTASSEQAHHVRPAAGRSGPRTARHGATRSW